MSEALIALLVKLLEPVIMRVVKNIFMSIDLNTLNNKSTEVKLAYDQLDQAKTSDDIKAAALAIAKSFNS